MDKASRLLQRSKHAIARAYCLLYLIGVYEDEDKADAEAFQLLTTECDTSDPHALFLLGWCYDDGYGCAQDKAQAFQCYERAGNDIEALMGLADLLFQQQDPVADSRAIALYRQAATQHCSRAQHILGIYYASGLPGVLLDKDIAQAKHWYSLAAEQGNCYAVNALKRLKTQIA
eukprot:TRINITY_DN7877_c0_g1_i4.p1 TRINITY_DN7877_c0_g1~~TRINITY_DN7877_c0_g1_i4.p1  ORF type:complete len:203 (+),score=54.26 TRINITY_DN7877_c0_g1_i4:88-609(+)